MDLGGNVVRIDADKIYQGSNDVDTIRLITPITPTGTAVQVGFTLPDGLTTVYYPLAAMGSYTLAELTSSGTIDAPELAQVYLWEIAMPENVTLQSGTVIITFKFTKPVNVEIVDELPSVGEPNTYYLCDGVYYLWTESVGIYTTTSTIAYQDDELTIPIGEAAEVVITDEKSDTVRRAKDIQIVGATTTYTQTATANTIVLDYTPNLSAYGISATADGEPVSPINMSYNSTLNRLQIAVPASVYTVTYKLALQTINHWVYFATDDCEEQVGTFFVAQDTIVAVDGVYKSVTTSPAPFTVIYAALPIPPEDATTSDVDQLITLLNLYYTSLSARVDEIERTRYIGTIAAADWEQVGNRYFYTLSAETHGYTHPIVTETLVEDEDGYTNAFFSFTILANNNISFVSDRAVNATFAIIG